MNPKKTLLVILASIVLVGLVRVVLPYLPAETEETEDTYEPEIKYLEENHTEVFLLGDDILFEEEFPYKKIQKIEEAEGEMSFCSIIMEGERTGFGGIWTESLNEGLKGNKYLLGDDMLDFMVEIIKSNE